MPTKLARTVASSVCGRVSHCSSVTITAIGGAGDDQAAEQPARNTPCSFSPRGHCAAPSA